MPGGRGDEAIARSCDSAVGINGRSVREKSGFT